MSFGNADSQPGNNTAQAQIAITRVDPLPTVDFGPSVTSAEGTAPAPPGSIRLSLMRQGDLSRESTVTYSLSAGPAPSASPDDIVGGFASGSVTFAANQVSALITVATTPDSFDEPDENVLLTLTGATEVTLVRTTLSLTIFDDDLPQRSADVSVTLTATPTVVDEMQPVQIRATVYNALVGDASNVTFSGLDAIVSTHIIDSLTTSQGTCAPVVPGSPVRCSLGSLTVWGTATVTVVARPTSGVFQGTSQLTANVAMSAVVSADELDPVPANNTAAGVFQVRRLTADLAIAKTTASAFQQGGTATYSLAVSNIGSGPTSGSYTIGDVMPSGLSIAGLTPGAGWDCSASAATVVNCTSITVLAPGQSAPVVAVNVAIATTAPDSVTNTATVVGGGETNTGNNTSSVTSAILRLPTIDFGFSSASPEGTSPGPAGDIAVNLERLGDLSRESTVTYSLSAGPAPSASPDDFVGGFISGSVTFAPNQASAPIRIFTTPDSLDEPDEFFLVTLTGTIGATLTRTSLGFSISDDDPPPSADLGVTLAAAPGIVDLLRPVTLTAVVTNGGQIPATNVAFTGFDSIVSTHLIDSITASQGSCAAAASPNPLQCLLGTLAPGASATVTVVARPTLTVFQGSSRSTLTVSAQAAVRADEQEPTPADNSASTSFDVRIPIADIQLTASIAPQVVDLLQPATITAVVRNNGPDVATNVTFRGLDLIVNTHTIDSVSASQGSCLPPPYNYSPITCQIGTLAPGASATVTVIARPTVGVFQYDFQQEIIVDALADATADQSDLTPANNGVLTSFRARRPAADLQLALTATPLVLDQPATYTATVTNLGPSAATNTIFRGLEFVFATHPVLSFVSSQGTCMFVPGGGAAPQCALGTLAAGGVGDGDDRRPAQHSDLSGVQSGHCQRDCPGWCGVGGARPVGRQQHRQHDRRGAAQHRHDPTDNHDHGTGQRRDLHTEPDRERVVLVHGCGGRRHMRGPGADRRGTRYVHCWSEDLHRDGHGCSGESEPGGAAILRRAPHRHDVPR